MIYLYRGMVLDKHQKYDIFCDTFFDIFKLVTVNSWYIIKYF